MSNVSILASSRFSRLRRVCVCVVVFRDKLRNRFTKYRVDKLKRERRQKEPLLRVLTGMKSRTGCV